MSSLNVGKDEDESDENTLKTNGSLSNLNMNSKKSKNFNMSVSQPTLCYRRILLGELTPLLMTMRRATPRWSSHYQVWCQLYFFYINMSNCL